MQLLLHTGGVDGLAVVWFCCDQQQQMIVQVVCVTITWGPAATGAAVLCM